jgi:hypothetical protein
MRYFAAIALCGIGVACNPVELGTPKYRVTVQGTLSDPPTAQTTHDAWANTVGASLPHHLTFAGSLNPSNGEIDPTQAIFIDTWDDADTRDKFYSSTKTKGAFASIFEGDYTLMKWEHPDGFAEWGAVDVAIASINPLFLFRIRGTFKANALDETRTTHNRVAGGASKEHAISLSDVTHAVNVEISDTHQALFIDFWQNPLQAGEYFTSDEAVSGGAEIFAPPGPQPIIFVPATDWVQW